MEKEEKQCSFCWELENRKSSIAGQPFKVLFETKYFLVKFSLFPVTPNHLLIVPKRHFAKATDMDFEELVDFQRCRQRIEWWYLKQGVSAWNSGDNYGRPAGQSIAHFHYHYFDRKEGDVKDPRGGIRNFMPPLENLGDYKDET